MVTSLKTISASVCQGKYFVVLITCYTYDNSLGGNITCVMKVCTCNSMDNFYSTAPTINYALFAVLTVLGILGVLVFLLIIPVKRPVCMSWEHNGYLTMHYSVCVFVCYHCSSNIVKGTIQHRLCKLRMCVISIYFRL